MPEWPSSARRAYFLRRLHVRSDIKGTRADFGSGVLHIISAMVPSCPLRAPLHAGLPGRRLSTLGWNTNYPNNNSCIYLFAFFLRGKHAWGVIQVM